MRARKAPKICKCGIRSAEHVADDTVAGRPEVSESKPRRGGCTGRLGARALSCGGTEKGSLLPCPSLSLLNPLAPPHAMLRSHRCMSYRVIAFARRAPRRRVSSTERMHPSPLYTAGRCRLRAID